jgi:glutamyl-tRNA synthetase
MELRRQDDDHEPGRACGALLARACRREPGHLRLPEARLDERRLPARAEQGIDWDTALVRRAAPLAQEKIETLGRFPEYVRFLFEPVDAVDGFDDQGRQLLAAAADALATAEPFDAERIEQALRGVADGLGLKPRQAFQPIRVAITGSTVSPGLFESLELLGRDASLNRIRRAADAGA